MRLEFYPDSSDVAYKNRQNITLIITSMQKTVEKNLYISVFITTFAM